MCQLFKKGNVNFQDEHMIKPYSLISQNSRTATTLSQSKANTAPDKIGSSKNQDSADAKLSTLAQQLHQAQIRADARDASLDREALADKAKSLRRQLSGEAYNRNKQKHDAEVPKSHDPAHIKRAEQATQFVNDQGKNPFKGFAPDQLTLIIYDDSGTFTTNERRAALSEQGDQEYAWRLKVVAELNRQWDQRNGDTSEALKGIMDHYDSLPPIEEAQIAGSWRYDMQRNIAYAKAEGRKHESDSKPEMKSFFEMLFENSELDSIFDRYQKDKADYKN